MKKCMAALLAALLTACGGGELEEDEAETLQLAEEQQEYRPAPRAALARHPVKAVMFGDSTEAGSAIRRVTNPAKVAQRWFDARNLSYQVTEEAAGGTTAHQLLLGQDRRHDAPFDQTLQGMPDVRVVSFRYGINEVRAGTPEEFRAALRALVELSLAAGKRVILQTPSPVSREDLLAEVEQNVTVIRQVARTWRGRGVTLCDQWRLGHYFGVTDTIDGVHPTIEAYAFQGRIEARCILRAMR